MTAPDNALGADERLLKRREADRQRLIRRESEDYLRRRCRQAMEAGRPWTLDFASPEAYARSCRRHRQRLSEALGELRFEAPFRPRLEPFCQDDTYTVQWLTIDLDEDLPARAALAIPRGGDGPVPLVIAQHGVGSSPERVFGFNDPGGLYHGFGRTLARAGFAVLAPHNVTEAAPRARLHRLCQLLGGTLAGLEIGKIRRLLDFALTLPRIDPGRVGMWGLSLGGFYTSFVAPLDERIKAAVNAAFFNDRYSKMAVPSPLYSSFLDADSEDIWLPGWLGGGFGDAELAALICPRAYQVQQGRCDGIGWWPMQLAEFDRARQYYDKLGVGDRIEYADHTGGHEVLVDEGLAFLRKHLGPTSP